MKLKALVAATAAMFVLAGCGGTAQPAKEAPKAEKVTVIASVAANLGPAIQEIAAKYNETHPNVEFKFNIDSSGTLYTQIKEGHEADIFFSAAQKQMNMLEADGLLVDGSRVDVVNNRLALIKPKGADTEVTTLAELAKAKSATIAGPSVPAGLYTRIALMKLGVLPEGDAAAVTTAQLSEVLGGVHINEAANVKKALMAVSEGSTEVGTSYYSDTYAYEDKVDIIEIVDPALTGAVTMPVGLVKNKNASEARRAAAKEFKDYLLSDAATEIFKKYRYEPVGK